MKITNAEADCAPRAYTTESFTGDLHELLKPTETSALGFQTYQYFDSDKSARDAAETAFLAEETDTIAYDYTKLFDAEGNPISFAAQKKSLENIMTRLRDPNNTEIDDDYVAEVTFMSAAFRYKEIEFVEVVQRLNDPAITDREREFYAEKYRRLNEALYGSPDPRIYKMIRGEIWASIDSKDFPENSRAAQIKKELEDGCSARGREVAPFERGEIGVSRLSKEAADWVKEYLYDEFGQYYDLCKQYWEKVVLPRARDEGIESEYSGEDLYVLFSAALVELDPEGSSSITIEKNPNASNLSWNTPTMSVNVGMAKRAIPIYSPEKAFGKLLHELLGHGGRTVSGLKSDIPATGFGIFSDLDEGGSPDYLSFEEGVLIIYEAIVQGDLDKDSPSQWKAENTAHYTAISMAELEGRDTAEIYETLWRARVLMNTPAGEDISEDQVDKAKKAVARTNVRYKRSLPQELPESRKNMTWHKDLAYALGRIKAIPLLQELYERRDLESLRNLLKTHTDPTNRYQNYIAEQAGYPVRLSAVHTEIA